MQIHCTQQIHTDMDSVSIASPLPSHSGLSCQLWLLQFLNQLRTQHNITTQEDVQHCVGRLELEDKRLKQLIGQQEKDYCKLSAKFLDLQNSHVSTGREYDLLEERLEKYEEKISTLERQVEKEKSNRVVCERDAKLQKALEQTKELINCNHNDNGTINKILITLQLISRNQNIEKDIYLLENQLSIANETIQNSTVIFARQSRELEEETKKTKTLKEQNSEVEMSLCRLQKQLNEQNQIFQGRLQEKEEELEKKDEELKKKDNELSIERIKNTELREILIEIHKKPAFLQDEAQIFGKYISILHNQRNRTETLEEQNTQLQTSLRDVQKHQHEQYQHFQAELQKKTEELKKKDNELIEERKRNVELQNFVIESHKRERDCEIHNAELEAERRNCSTELQQEKTGSKFQLKIEEKKAQEAQNLLNNCNEELNGAKEQSATARKNITKVIEFANQYRKYLASGNFHFAIAVYGDSEIKDIFRLSESIFSKRMTNQEAQEEAFSCGNDRYIPKCFKCDGADDCGNRNDERNCSTGGFPVGARVVPGPHWNWENEDVGPSGVGTVIKVEYPAYNGPNIVRWDNGKSTRHIGAEGKMEVRAAAGYFCEPTRVLKATKQ